MSEAAPQASDAEQAYTDVRDRSEALCAPLAIEDYGVQPMDDASPPKWHLAHTTWFFETFLLKPLLADYRPFHPEFEYLFNSYYEGVGERHPRALRGNLSRPTVAEIIAYRAFVDDAMVELIRAGLDDDAMLRVTLGLQHEKQHQELTLTDLKYNLGHNPLRPSYRDDLAPDAPASAVAREFVKVGGGLVDVGLGVDVPSFCFDNETPAHKVYLEDFHLANRLVTNAEYLAFIEDGGYGDASLWLSDGWSELKGRGWFAPEYWHVEDGQWREYTLGGDQALDLHQPVSHVSFYEADAFARWAGARLPTEYEWEHACRSNGCDGAAGGANLARADRLHPARARGVGLTQMVGDCWEWTASNYRPYPGFQPLPGTLGEYNGKFMSNQMVLRGGSCATPEAHWRATYRNFFYAKDRWQFMGIRIAKDAA